MGLDISGQRVQEARDRLPSLDLRHGDAASMDYANRSFDLVMESTLFTQLKDNSIAGQVANEMIRVTRSGGVILLVDWRFPNPRDRSEASLSRRRVTRLFNGVQLERVQRGALVPPVGRRLSRSAPWLYFLVQRIAPIACAQVVYTLRVE
jgi:ubiquinone/menaquinone biosynthesis C-methylase UbiE